MSILSCVYMPWYINLGFASMEGSVANLPEIIAIKKKYKVHCMCMYTHVHTQFTDSRTYMYMYMHNILSLELSASRFKHYVF